MRSTLISKIVRPRAGRPSLLPTALIGALGLGGGLLQGCGADGDGDECVSTREFFANEILGGAMKSCAGCHEPGGLASEQNAAFKLWPSTYPGFIDANFDNVSEMARNQYDGIPLLLAKPSGKTDHGGGKVLDEDSDDYKALERLIEQLDDPKECDEQSGETIEGVVLLSEVETLRKASLHLVGRLPTQAEVDTVRAGGANALPGVVRGMLNEDAFFVRLEEIFNDMLLTDRYLAYTGFAVNLLDEAAWPAAGAAYDALPDDQRYAINLAVAREPLDLIAYIVKNDRPFTEIVTANYTVFNTFSAAIYQPAGVSFPDGATYGDLVEGTLSMNTDGGAVNVPHAGILSSPMFLNRFPTTPTNRNRHRARMVLDMFLATDILRIAERPIDPSAPTEYLNPTRENPACTVCHSIIDPIAGGFQKYDEYDQEEYIPAQEWHTDMFSPGFGEEDMPTSDYGVALQWLGTRIAGDPRFALATTYTVYRGLTGLEPLAYPTDPSASDYQARQSAWYAQEEEFSRIGKEFVDSGYDLKTVITGVVLSPYFRARAVEMPEGGDPALYEGMGVGRLSTPELLAKKISAVTGARWIRGWDLSDYLLTDYRILYGGIDSDTVTNRLTSMNGIMASVAWRLANEVSCGTTAWDFSKPAEERLLFPHVELDVMPESESGFAVPEAIDAIKANIQHLHYRVLGEDLELTDPEIEHTFNLFVETWKEGAALVASDPGNGYLTWQCQARANPLNPAQDLPESQWIQQDPNYTVRAWMAVMTYLISDYRFLYE
ncbi:MAG: DUF1588 domain-containing protein [Myxococcales bacterium]|nr:DUF1588 domain-containing protein [Myxococcales bacterium]MCB9754010.1 DUF1588 domain-containing protein [Myxococcales bacterium]